MNQNDVNLVGSYIRKLYKVLLIVVGMIVAVELALSVRGLLFFNLARLKHRLYLYSYLFLFAVSAVMLILFLLCGNKEKHTKRMVIQTYIYAACLIVWAAFVSSIDCVANGDSGVMVFIMVSISVGGLVLINPMVYSIVLTASAAALMGVVYALRGQPYSMGFYINYSLFMILAIFINAQNYRLHQRNDASNAKLEHLSYTDQLTGIYNRRHFDAQIEKCCESDQNYLFMLTDVDDFKLVNDTYGHAVGDECLILIAQKLKEQFGEYVYRFGGDEFATICDLSEDQVRQRIDAINGRLANAYEGINLRISVGVYHAEKGDSSNTIFTRMDIALYEAKADDRNACRIFTKK